MLQTSKAVDGGKKKECEKVTDRQTDRKRQTRQMAEEVAADLHNGDVTATDTKPVHQTADGGVVLFSVFLHTVAVATVSTNKHHRFLH